MAKLTTIIAVLFVLSAVVLVASAKENKGKSQEEALAQKLLDGMDKKMKLAKKEKKDKKDKEERSPAGMKLYHHVHHSVASKDVKPKQKFPKMVSAKVFGADDIEAEKLDELRKAEKNPKNALVAEYEMKYQKILAEVINDLKVTMKTPTYIVLKEVEKRMEEKEQKTHVKTSARMMEYLRRMIAKLYERYEEDGKDNEKYGIKEFVSNVFGKYRMRHEEDQERKRRITQLTDHISKKHNKFEHRKEFHDTFYTPKFKGFDEETGAPLHVYAPLESAKKFGEHEYNANYNGDLTYESPTTLKAAAKGEREPGLIPRTWRKMKGFFNA